MALHQQTLLHPSDYPVRGAAPILITDKELRPWEVSCFAQGHTAQGQVIGRGPGLGPRPRNTGHYFSIILREEGSWGPSDVRRRRGWGVMGGVTQGEKKGGQLGASVSWLCGAHRPECPPRALRTGAVQPRPGALCGAGLRGAGAAVRQAGGLSGWL